ncbi:MAG: hypothetical protein R3C20_05645 [Planctomycetaceae bacterium]
MFLWLGVLAGSLCSHSALTLGDEIDEKALQVPAQPLLAQVHRLSEALEVVGRPLSEAELDRLAQIKSLATDEEVSAAIERLLDPYCLAAVNVAESGPPQVSLGSARTELLEQGWRTFLIKVINRPGRTGRLFVESPNARPLPHAPSDEVDSRWMQISTFEGQPMRANLSGLALEYRIVQVYSRDAGAKTATLEFNVSGDPKGDRDLIREWRFDSDTDGWQPANQINIDASDGSLQVTSTGEDPFMMADVQSRGGPMMLRFWAKAGTGGIGQLFWWTSDIPSPTADRQTNFLLEPNKEHLYEIPFQVDGELAGVRLDPLVQPGEMRIDWIDLYSAQRSENWAKLPVDFNCQSSTEVTFNVIDDEGLPAFTKFEIRDREGRIYPAQSKRLAPDFFFQRHIYRGHGETVSLPPGQYTIQCSRGPETIPETKTLTVGQ